jgi:preprotein translocase subunit secB
MLLQHKLNKGQDMNIKLVDYKVIETIFQLEQNVVDIINKLSDMKMDEYEDNLKFSPIYSDDNDKEFFVLFDLNFSSNEEEINKTFSFKFVARFETSDIITNEFKQGNFPKVNAPAIAYPFFRAFVNNYFINAGYNPVLLPTYNFTKFKKN